MSGIQRQASLVFDDSDDQAIYEHNKARLGKKKQQMKVEQREPSDHHKDFEFIPSDDEASSSDEISESRHPYYNYATEKHDVSADSKLIYQRFRQDTKSEHELLGSPLLLSKSKTLPPGWLDSHGVALGRSPSMNSNRSRPGNMRPNIDTKDHAREPFPSLQDQATSHKANIEDYASAADAQVRSRHRHPELPHESKDPLLANAGIHGAGAGVGLGTGSQGFAKTEGAVVTEVEGICDKIKHVLDLRRSYLKVSLQCPGDDPRDDPDWDIYPQPPQPVWTEDKQRPILEANGETSMSNSVHDTTRNVAPTPNQLRSTASFAGSEKGPQSPNSKRPRKYGQAIGEDFDLDDCYIPGADNSGKYFELDPGSIYQVYDKDQKPIVDVPTLRDYYLAMDTILDISSDGPAKSFAYRRLQYLEGRYDLYALLNEYE